MTIPLQGQEHLGLGCTYEQQSADKDWYNEQGSVHKWHLESLSKFELKHHLSSHSYSWHHHNAWPWHCQYATIQSSSVHLTHTTIRSLQLTLVASLATTEKNSTSNIRKKTSKDPGPLI